MSKGAKMPVSRDIAVRHKQTLPLVQRLAAERYYSDALEVVRASGFWDEEAVPEEEKEKDVRVWRVCVSADLKAYAYVTVHACDEEDAMGKALEEVERCEPDWEIYGTDDVVPEDAEPVRVRNLVHTQTDLEDYT